MSEPPIDDYVFADTPADTGPPDPREDQNGHDTAASAPHRSTPPDDPGADDPGADDPGAGGSGRGDAPGPFDTTSREELIELVSALRRRLHDDAETLAEATLSEHLTPELYHALRTHTAAAVLDSLGGAPAPTVDPSTPPERKKKTPETYFRSLDEFVDQWLFTVYRREVTDTNERRWCRGWRRHGEAVARLDALWHMFEVSRTDPGPGASVLWKDHLDVHMDQLMSPTGPFEHCSVRDGHTDRLAPLPSEPAPSATRDTTPAHAPADSPTALMKGHLR